MIELKLTGTVDAEQTYEDEGEDGGDEYAVSNTVRQTIEVKGELAFPHGHVNLEGYVLSEHWATPNDMLYSFEVPKNPALDDWRVLEDSADLEVGMFGGGADWVEQAVRYVTERPNLSVYGALEKFGSWDETRESDIFAAKGIVSDTENAVQPVGGLETSEYAILTNQLHNAAQRKNSGVEIADLGPSMHEAHD